jgi:hypothetical protein
MDADEDAPLVDSGAAADFFAAAANMVKAEKGADAVAADKSQLDIKGLFPSWESKVDEAAAKAGLDWLL